MDFFSIRRSIIASATFLSFAVGIAPLALAQKQKGAPKPLISAFKSKYSNIDRSIDSLLKLMTLEEKIGQLNLLTSDLDVTGASLRPQYRQDIEAGRVGSIFNAYGTAYVRKLQELAVQKTRLHIPLIFGYDVIHGHKTIFPMPLAMASSWDLSRIEGAQRIAAIEASAMGLDWTFAPMVDIARDPRWGRVMESAGEDTYLGSLIAAAQVRGFQGTGLGSTSSVMACAKHFAAYGAAQAGRDYNTVDISERVLRDVYLPPFKAASDAGVATFMTAFNELDGVPATASKHLLDDILRKEWGFKGFVVTDYTAIMEMIFHGASKDSAEAGMHAILASNDMDMQAGIYSKFLPKLVKEGKVPEAMIDESARRILRKKFELGLFDNPYRRLDPEREKTSLLTPAHRLAAREMAARSCVLLQNNNGVLPIKSTVKKIAVIGPLADAQKDMIGAWSAAGDDINSVTLLQGLKNSFKGVEINYLKGVDITKVDFEKDNIEENKAIKLAKEADLVILALGEGKDQSGEAASRSDISLPGAQLELLTFVKQAGKPIVVVLFNGRPLELGNVISQADAVLEAWYPGTEAGNAVADVLSGAYNPSGKLTITFPRSAGQIPLYYNQKNTGRPIDVNQKYTSKYLDIPNTPLFPFGYGLSYTTFSYGAPTISKPEMDMGDSLQLKVRITNTGKLAGEEIVQLYVQDQVGSVTRPVKELKGFKKIKLLAGQSEEISFIIKTDDLRFYTKEMKFAAEPGDFKAMVGPNSADLQSLSFKIR